MTRAWNRELALWAALLTLLPSARAAWTELPLPNLSGYTVALAHLPDGRYVYADTGQFFIQDAFGASASTAFSGEPALDPSFIAIYSSTNAVAGRGFGTAPADLYAFDPSAPGAPGFSNLNPVVQTYYGVYRDAGGLYTVGAAGFAPSAVSYVALDGSVNQIIISNVSAYSAGIARDAAGNLFVGDNDNGEVRKFTAAQLTAAIGGPALTMADGDFVCDLGNGGDITTLAVDGLGRLWAAGWLHNGLWVYDPARATTNRITPGLDNANYYTVLAFQAGGVDYVGYVNLAGYTPGSTVRYGYAPALSAVPFSDELSGVAAAGLTHHDWISAVVSYVSGPTPGSGGFAHDDAGVTSSVSTAVIGKPSEFSVDGQVNHVASLGNGGRITVTFERPISDGPGADFAVFENGFTDFTPTIGTSRESLTNSFSFAELAYVEVGSSLGAWARFPITALNTDLLFHIDSVGDDRFASQDVTGLDGLAGKHVIDQGTPFDLAFLTNHPAVLNGAVNLALIRYVRLTDVVGDGSVTDDYGHAVLDPFYDATAAGIQPASAAATDGFDLRGIAVLNAGEAVVQAGSAGPLISCDGVARTVYRLESAASMRGPTWTPLTVVTGRGQRITWTNTPATSCVYRVQRWALP